MPVETQISNVWDGAFTVRSNASFAVMPGATNTWSLAINASGELVQLPLGPADRMPKFLDINQGMQPYTILEHPGSATIQRYDITGTQLGALGVDQRACRPALRSVYVDRGGEVWSMCVDQAGITIAKHTMAGPDGAPLPRIEELFSGSVWSPDRLPAAPA